MHNTAFKWSCKESALADRPKQCQTDTNTSEFQCPEIVFRLSKKHPRLGNTGEEAEQGQADLQSNVFSPIPLQN